MEPPVGPEPVSMHEDTTSAIQSIQTAASRHAEEFGEVIQIKREQLDIERAAGRERIMKKLRQEHARLDEEREVRIKGLETVLAQVKASFESESALRDSKDLERHEAFRVQLNDITNLVQEQWDECSGKKELMDERWNEERNRRAEKDAQIDNLYDIVTKIIEDREAERIRKQGERIAVESRPGTGRALEELARQYVEQHGLLAQIAESWKNSLVGDGGCLCRATTYAFSKAPQNLPDDFNWEVNYVVPGGKDENNKWAASHCYCDSCRVSVGALAVTWFSVPWGQFKLQKKGPTTVYRSSSHATREFCSMCGASLFFHDANESEFIDITLGSVSAKNLSEYIQVTAHIWLGDAEEQTLRSKGEGLGLAAIINDGLPRWKQGRGSERL